MPKPLGLTYERGKREEAPAKKRPMSLVARKRMLQDRAVDIKQTASRFDLPAREVTRLIREGNIDKAVGHFQKQMLDAVTRIIPIAERQYRKNPTQSYAYALNALVSQARELAGDLQNTGDRQKLAFTLAHEILMPAFRSVAQAIVDEHYRLRRSLEDKLSAEDRPRVNNLIESSGENIARVASEQYKQAVQNINQAIVK